LHSLHLAGLTGAQESREDETQQFSMDAQGLGPRQAGPFTVGFVDMIVGKGGLEVPEFVATKHEIIQLVRYWATEIIDLDFEFFLYGCTGSSEWRTHVFANRRLTTISKVLGEEEVTKAVMQAKEDFAKTVDQRAWKIFTTGTKEERELFQNEVQEKLSHASEGDHKVG
jgi:hypothetical protein